MRPAGPERDDALPQNVDRLALDLQSALTVEDVHRRYLGAVAGMVSADAYGLSQFAPAGRRLLVQSTSTRQAPQGLVADYNDVGAETDPVLTSSLRRGAPIDNSRAISDRTWYSSPTFEVLRAHGLEHSLVATLWGKKGVLGALYLARKKSSEPFATQDLIDIELAQRHVSASLERAIQQAKLHRQVSLVGYAFDQLEAAVVVADEAGVLFESEEARKLREAGPVVASHIEELVAMNVEEMGRSGPQVIDRFALIDLPGDGAQGGSGTRRLNVRSTMSPGDLDAVVSYLYVQDRDQRPPVDDSPLSAREREIVVWVAQGLTNRQIAERAFVSENTVRQHLKRIFRKLDVHNRAQLVQAIWQTDGNAPDR